MAPSRTLNVAVTGDSRDYERALARAGKSTDKFAKTGEHAHVRIRRSFMGMSASAAKAGAGIAAAYVSIEGAKKAISTTEELAHTTISLHRNLGLSVKAASEWAAVARARGVDTKALNMSFGTLSKNVEAGSLGFDKMHTKIDALGNSQKDQIKRHDLLAKGAGAQADALKSLGVSEDQIKRGNFQDVLRTVSDGFLHMHAGTERTALSMKLFGRGWQTVVPILRGGSKAMDEQLKLADKYGVTFKGKTIKSLEDLIKAQREAKFATMGLQVAFGTELAPVLTKVIGKVTTFVAQMRDGTGAGGRFAKKMGDVWQSLKPIVGTARDVATWLSKHPGLLKAAGAAWVTYKTVALVQLAQTKLAMIGIFSSGSTRVAEGAAGKAGGRAGRAYKAAFVVGATVGLYNELVGPFNSILERLTGQIDATDPTNGAGQRRADERTAKKYGSGKNQPSNAPRLQKTDPKYLPKVPRKRRGKSASVAVTAHASGEAGGQEFGSLQRAAAWVNANYGSDVGTLLEDSGGGNQHLHIEGPKSTVVAIGKALQRQGFGVGENPSFGGVHPVHSHGGLPGIPGDHYTGNAIDVNADNRSLRAPGGGGGGGGKEKVKWRECTLTWYDPGLGGTNSGTGKADPNAPTASGELYNPAAFTCAAPQGYSFGTIIAFRYGGRMVACKVNDRGGAITGHHFDLSRAAAAALGIMGAGRARAQFALPGKSKSIRKAKTPLDKLENLTGYIGLETAAGVLTEEAGAQQTIAAVNRALPTLHGSARLQALGTRRTAQTTLRDIRAGRREKAAANRATQRAARTVDTTINNPWLQAYLDHQDNLQAAGDIDAITARENKAAALERAIGHGLSGEDALRARGMVNDLRGQNYDEISGRTAPGQVDSVSDEGVRLAHIDAQVRAGDLTPEQGRQAKIASIQDALTNWVGLSDDARLELRGELKDLLDENTQAQADNTQALKDLQKSIDDQTNFAKSVAATEAGAMAQWVTEVISKQMGFGISGRALTPAYGVARRS